MCIRDRYFGTMVQREKTTNSATNIYALIAVYSLMILGARSQNIRWAVALGKRNKSLTGDSRCYFQFDVLVVVRCLVTFGISMMNARNLAKMLEKS